MSFKPNCDQWLEKEYLQEMLKNAIDSGWVPGYIQLSVVHNDEIIKCQIPLPICYGPIWMHEIPTHRVGGTPEYESRFTPNSVYWFPGEKEKKSCLQTVNEINNLIYADSILRCVHQSEIHEIINHRSSE